MAIKKKVVSLVKKVSKNMQIIIHRVGCTNQQEIRNNKIKDAFPFGKASFIIPLRNLMNYW